MSPTPTQAPSASLQTRSAVRRVPAVIAWRRLASPLGPIVLAASGLGLCGLWFEGQRHPPDRSAWPQRPDDRHAVLDLAEAQLQHFWETGAALQTARLPIDLAAGTPFQQSVWGALLDIAPGTVATYAQVAARLGQPTAVRAVGAAVGRNPVSLFVPCHRVLGSGGQLTGYAGGLERKQALLAREQRAGLVS